MYHTHVFFFMNKRFILLNVIVWSSRCHRVTLPVLKQQNFNGR